jgi:hypothetical protein
MIQWFKNQHYTCKQPWTLKFEIKQQGVCCENSEALNIDDAPLNSMVYSIASLNVKTTKG